jgi:hypothetical protein
MEVLMKQFLIFALFSVASVQSWALVADRFRCEFTIEANGSALISKHRQDFAVARLPYKPHQPVPDVTFTQGSAPAAWMLHDESGEFLLNMNFYYNHALRNTGGKTEARQFTCLTVSGTYCAKGDQGCTELNTMCGEYSDPNPFDPIHGWTETSVQDGVPMFNARTLAPIKITVSDLHAKLFGTAAVTCTHVGAYW